MEHLALVSHIPVSFGETQRVESGLPILDKTLSRYSRSDVYMHKHMHRILLNSSNIQNASVHVNIITVTLIFCNTIQFFTGTPLADLSHPTPAS